MIQYKSTRQLSLDGFHLPFGGKLNPDNRWVKWSLAIPWDELAAGYYKSMSSGQGRPGKDGHPPFTITPSASDTNETVRAFAFCNAAMIKCSVWLL